MKKMISLILVLVVCLSFCCSVYASEFVDSPNQNPTISECEHTNCELVNQRDATCTNEGYTGDLVCSECGTVVEAGQTVAKLDHQYGEDGICTVCGQEKDTPATGDTSKIGLWIGVMLFAAVALVAIVVVYNKKFARR